MKNLIKLLPLLLLFACQKEEPKPTLEIPSAFVFDKLDFGETGYFTFKNGEPVKIGAAGSFLNYETELKNETLESPFFWTLEKITLLTDSELKLEYTPDTFQADTTLTYFTRGEEIIIPTGFDFYPELKFQLSSDFEQLRFCYESISANLNFNSDLIQGSKISRPCESPNFEEVLDNLKTDNGDSFQETDSIAINFSHFVFEKN